MEQARDDLELNHSAAPVWTYTNANVVEGKFTYSYSSPNARHNAILVEYADKDNSYEKVQEYLSNNEAVHKHSLNPKKITAFSCISRGQANRTECWLLETERLENKNHQL